MVIIAILRVVVKEDIIDLFINIMDSIINTVRNITIHPPEIISRVNPTIP